MYKIYTYSPSEYFGSNTYLIESKGKYAIVDPSVPFEEISKEHPDFLNNLEYILLTHSHFDHMITINEFTGGNARVCIGKQDQKGLCDPVLNCYMGFLGVNDGYFGESTVVENGTYITLGDEEISVIECPGHTPGGVGYILDNNIFIGDTLFEGGGCGRCDLPGGDINILGETLGKLFACTEDYILYPGHGNKTLLSETKRYF